MVGILFPLFFILLLAGLFDIVLIVLATFFHLDRSDFKYIHITVLAIVVGAMTVLVGLQMNINLYAIIIFLVLIITLLCFAFFLINAIYLQKKR